MAGAGPRRTPELFLKSGVWLVLAGLIGAVPAIAGPIGEMQPIGNFAIDRTEVTIGQFEKFIAATGFVTQAEKVGGGLVYQSGWQRKPGWTWRAPFGTPASESEPVVHINFDEANAYCEWAGKRLPTDAEWVEAAFTERRATPPAPFEYGKTYEFPNGSMPDGANCLEDCGPSPAIDYSAVLDRGRGPARAGTTQRGVNGLYDMGANVWEWVDHGAGDAKRTRGGSWWYGRAQMRQGYLASKPREMAVVYIGFRCAKDRR
jgi:formylglycine-generating enzyme